MLELHRSGKSFVKKDYYRNLTRCFPERPEKAFEYRAQNISHVLALLGREWLPGLVPAKNVGSNVVARLERILSEAEGTCASGNAEFEARVRAAQAPQRPTGNLKPEVSVVATSSYMRDPVIGAWVLSDAVGTCESCGQSSTVRDARWAAILGGSSRAAPRRRRFRSC